MNGFNDLKFTILVTAAANLIEEQLTDDELNLATASFVQIGEVLAPSPPDGIPGKKRIMTDIDKNRKKCYNKFVDKIFRRGLKMKKALALLVALVLAVGMFPVMTVANTSDRAEEETDISVLLMNRTSVLLSVFHFAQYDKNDPLYQKTRTDGFSLSFALDYLMWYYPKDFTEWKTKTAEGSNYDVPAEVFEEVLEKSFIFTEDIATLRNMGIYNATTNSYNWRIPSGTGFACPFRYICVVETESNKYECYIARVDGLLYKSQIKNLKEYVDYMAYHGETETTYSKIEQHYKITLTLNDRLPKFHSIEEIEVEDLPELHAMDGTIENEDCSKDILNGESGGICLEIKDISESVLKEHKDLIQTAVGKNGKITHYLDISLLHEIGFGKYERITETNGDVIFSLEVPEELWNSNGEFHRNYRIVRIHDGKTDVLQANFDKKTGRLTFKTNAFSTYAITYEDVPMDEWVELNTDTSGNDTNSTTNSNSSTPTDKPANTSSLTASTNTPDDGTNQISDLTEEEVSENSIEDDDYLPEDSDLPSMEEEISEDFDIDSETDSGSPTDETPDVATETTSATDTQTDSTITNEPTDPDGNESSRSDVTDSKGTVLSTETSEDKNGFSPWWIIVPVAVIAILAGGGIGLKLFLSKKKASAPTEESPEK